jgi:hypothetical protein
MDGCLVYLGKVYRHFVQRAEIGRGEYLGLRYWDGPQYHTSTVVGRYSTQAAWEQVGKVVSFFFLFVLSKYLTLL